MIDDIGMICIRLVTRNIYICVLEEILREHFLILHYYRIGWSMFFPRPPRSEENFPLAINKRTIRQSGWAVITCAMNNERDGKKADFCGMLKRESLDNGGVSRRRGTETKKKEKNNKILIDSLENIGLSPISFRAKIVSMCIFWWEGTFRLNSDFEVEFEIRNWILNRGNDFVGPIDWIHFQTNVSNDKKRSG